MTMSRRKFVHATAGLTIAASIHDSAAAGRDASGDMPLGVIARVADPDADIAYVRELGFTTCQMTVAEYSSTFAERVASALSASRIKPTSLICMGPGRYEWNFYDGPRTIGLVPRDMRKERVARLREGIDFCTESGIPAVLAHFGFIPENPNDDLYGEFIDVMKDVAGYASSRSIEVHFETGQETPITLLRAITDIGYDNLGVNYDTANLILYGKANPVDGLEVIGNYVRSLHAKDGLYPTDPHQLGRETPIGDGWVDFPAVISKLKAFQFKGHITIEREISGEQQVKDILAAKEYLSNLIKTV